MFAKPHIVDYILIQNIPKALIDEFGGTPKMLIDIIKATEISNIFPGTNPTIVENALYYNKIEN